MWKQRLFLFHGTFFFSSPSFLFFFTFWWRWDLGFEGSYFGFTTVATCKDCISQLATFLKRTSKTLPAVKKRASSWGQTTLCCCGQTCPFPSTTGRVQSTAAAPGESHEWQEEAAAAQTPCELASLHQPLELAYRFLPFQVGFTIILSPFSQDHMVTCHLGRKGSDAIFLLSLKPCRHLGKNISGIPVSLGSHGFFEVQQFCI